MKLSWQVDWRLLAQRSGAFRLALPVVAGCLLFALGCLFRFPHWWQLEDMEHARQGGLAQVHELKTAELLALSQTRQRLDDAQRELRDARWRLAAGSDMSDLLDQLAASGHAHGLHFEQLDVMEETKQVGYVQTPLQIQVMGRYSALRLWLDDWLGQVRLLRAEDLQLAPVDNRPGLLRLGLRVIAYQADVPVPEPDSLAHLPARREVLPPVLDPFAAWVTRLAQSGLTQVPLAQLEMVGSLQRGQEHEALLLLAGRLHRVRAGDKLGRDDGVVVRIGEQQLEVQERLFVGGMWRERTVVLTLRKRVDREVSHGDEMAGEVGDGGAAAVAVGHGGALSG